MLTICNLHFFREYLNKELDQIPLDEQFIYKYLKEKRANQIEEEESDAESVNSEEFNEAIDNIQHEDVDFAANVNDAELEKSGSEDEEEMELDGVSHFWVVFLISST